MTKAAGSEEWPKRGKRNRMEWSKQMKTKAKAEKLVEEETRAMRRKDESRGKMDGRREKEVEEIG
jgi:hypothetical protein